MQIVKILGWILWRLWFYFLVIIPILIMFPLLFVSLLQQAWYPYFFRLARIWAKVIIYGMGFYYKIKIMQPILPNKSYMFIGNHTSMLDIMLMLVVTKNPFVFVGKKELAKFPIFGFFYKRAAILVDRNDPKSRVAVYKQAQSKIKQGLSICIFPEGRVPDDQQIVLDDFKSGAFNLAIDHKLDIVPVIFKDNKKRFSYSFFSGSPGMLNITIAPFISTQNTTNLDRVAIKNKAWQLIYSYLVK